MALVVNTNISSINAQRQLLESRNAMETAMERLASGSRINSAADDAAGLAISTRMDTQMRGLNMAIRNANDGISLTQTAEGAMQEVTEMLQRMRELALQSVHGVNNDDDRNALDSEVQALKSEIDRVAETTTFNNQEILNGTFDRLFQIGFNSSETLGISIADMSTEGLGLFGEDESVLSPNTLVSTRYDFDTAGSWGDGDITINGQAIDAFDNSSQDFFDLTTNINANVDNVAASAFNSIVAKEAGSGIVTENTVAIKVAAVGESGDDWYIPEKEVTLGVSDSLQGMVDNINNAFDNNEVVASINADGKLVLSNETGARISLEDITGTASAFDGATGFEVGTGTITASGSNAYTTELDGFLRLTSTDESAIEIELGNSALADDGTEDDIALLGFNRIVQDPSTSSYTVIGKSFAAETDITNNKLERDSTTGVADLSINGIEIFDAELSDVSNTFQGKIDLINAFTDETDVVASAYFEKSIDMSDVTFIDNQQVRINGVAIDYGDGAGTANISTLAANINAESDKTGITAVVNGQNLVLKGDGVESITVENVDYELSDDTVQFAARRIAGASSQIDAGSLAQTATFGATDVQEGRVFTLSIDMTQTSSTGANAGESFLLNDASLSAYSSGVLTYEYTVASGDTATDVAEAFEDLLILDLVQVGAIGGSASITGSAGNFISVDSGKLMFLGGASGIRAGSASISIGVKAVPSANLAFGVAEGTETSYYGALKLQSVNEGPISIELGEGVTAGELGLTELNVGDTTYDKNAPTFNVNAQADSTVGGLSVSTSAAAQDAIDVLDAALENVSEMRGSLGAIQNRLDHTVSNLSNVVENTAASKSRIADADFAVEAAALARAQVLQQAGTAMLAQANAVPQNVLSLLG